MSKLRRLVPLPRNPVRDCPSLFFLLASAISPQAWTPPRAVIDWSVSTELSSGNNRAAFVRKWDAGPGAGFGPEDVALDAGVVSTLGLTMDASFVCRPTERSRKFFPTHTAGRWDWLLIASRKSDRRRRYQRFVSIARDGAVTF